MTYTHKAAPEPQAILRAWIPFKEAVGVTSVRTEEDYTQARTTIEVLLDEVGDNESHPLADVLDYLADQVAAYEAEHYHIPEAEPRAVLRFLMDQHGLKQEDLADCVPQSRISDILSGRRGISIAIAQKLARRFHVRADLFLAAADEVVVMKLPPPGDEEGAPVFGVAVVALNQRYRLAGEIKEWIRSALPLEAANALAHEEGQHRGLPVILWAEEGGSEVLARFKVAVYTADSRSGVRPVRRYRVVAYSRSHASKLVVDYLDQERFPWRVLDVTDAGRAPARAVSRIERMEPLDDL